MERGGLDAPHNRFKHDTSNWRGYIELHNEVFWAQELHNKFSYTLKELLKYNQHLQGIEAWLKPKARLQGFWLEVLTLWVKQTYVTGCNRLPLEEILTFPLLYNTSNCFSDRILLK